MERPDLQQLFQKYLDGTCSASEAEELLNYIHLEHDREYVEQLIGQNLDNPIAEELAADLEVQSRLEQSRVYLHQKIQDGKVRRMPVRHLWIVGIAASVALFMAAGWLLRTDIANWLHPVKMEQLTTLKGEHKQVTLADGSVVWLSAASTLKYPQQFNRDTREIELNGAAFFEVAKDKKHPFIVHTGQVTTQVLGTSFHIDAYTERPDIEVTLLTGKVLLKNGNDTTHLLPNQQGTVSKKTGKIKKVGYPNAAKFLAERNGVFEYEGEPAIMVIAEIQRQFNANIRIEGPINNRGFYGSFSVDDGLEMALRKLCMTIGARYEMQDGVIIVRPMKNN